MPEMKTLCGYEVVDAKAREDIKELQNAGHATEEYVDEAIAAIPKPDYTGLATEAYVDNAIDNIPEVDLSKHALKSELPTKVSQLQNDSKFITREEVPETDLSAYAKKSEIPDVSDFITSIPSEYITESELNAKGYLTQHQDISGKADKNHTHTEYLTEHQDISHLAPKSSIPTKVSQLANDSNYLTSIPSTYITEAELEAKNYLTEHQSLAAYATKTYVDNTVAENQPNLSGYAKKSDIPDVSDFISEIPSEYVTEGELAAKKYATESYVGEAIAQAQLGGEDVDLSEYAKKTDVPTKTSQLTNDSNFLTAIPAEYVTETELDNKGYLTEHQSLDGKADKVHTHTEYVSTIDFTEYQMGVANDMANHKHSDYANKTHNHSMADITDYVAPEIPSLDGYATKLYVDDAVSDCKDVYLLDFSKATESSQPADEQMISFGDSFARTLKQDVSVMIKVPSSPNYFWPALVSINGNSVIFTPIALNLNDCIGAAPRPLTWDVISLVRSFDSTAGDFIWKYSKLATSSTTLASTEYVDNAVANIDIPESNSSFYDLVFGASGTGTAVTDAKTIEYLEAYFRGELPLCALHGMPVINVDIYSNTLTLYAVTPASSGFSSTTHIRVFTRNAENDWTFKTNSNMSKYHYNKTSQLTNDAGFVTQSAIDTSLEGYATETYVDNAIASIGSTGTTPDGEQAWFRIYAEGEWADGSLATVYFNALADGTYTPFKDIVITTGYSESSPSGFSSSNYLSAIQVERVDTTNLRFTFIYPAGGYFLQLVATKKSSGAWATGEFTFIGKSN